MIADDAPLTSRSPERQMHERPASFSRAGEASERPMQDLSEPVSTGKPPPSVLPLLFRVFNAVTGSRDKPATHHMPSDVRHVLLHLANRAKNETGIARGANESLVTATGLGASTVRRALADLLAHRCISRAGTYGPPGREQPCFMVHDDGWTSWPEPTAKHRAPPSRPTAPPLQGERPGVSAAVPPVSVTPHPCHAGTPGVSAGNPRGVSGGDLPPSDPPSYHPATSQIIAPTAHAVAAPAGGPTKGQTVLFEPSPKPLAEEAAEEEKPQKANKGGDVPIESLTRPERRVYDAITGDESLRPIVADPARCARDLLTKGPGVDVAHEVKCAGIWLRDNPQNAKKNGRAFLSRWIGKAQERGARGAPVVRTDPNAYDPEKFRPPPEAWGPRRPVTVDPEILAGAAELERRRLAGERIPTSAEALRDLVEKLTPRKSA